MDLLFLNGYGPSALTLRASVIALPCNRSSVFASYLTPPSL